MGDFSRDTFDPAKAYSAVRMQQGRLFTDADFNEQGDIGRDAERASTRSMVGPSGFPESDAGFEIIAGSGSGALLIGAGEAYVDGIRIENAPSPMIGLTRRSGAGANTRWQVTSGTRVEIGEYLTLSGNGPDQAVRVSELFDDSDGLQVFKCAGALSAANQIDAMRYFSVEAQPHFPDLALPAADGDYLVYLDVWEREIGTIEDPSIREPAFGGPDTAHRDKVLWQARLAGLPGLIAAGAAAVPVTCKSFGPQWTPFGPGEQGGMAAQAKETVQGGDPCVLPATGGYRSLDNHLYRVEIHRGGSIAAGGFAVKWSRDNAIYRSAYSQIDGGKIVVDSLGHDEATNLKRNDWIEVLDEDRILKGASGFFARISDINGTRLSIDKLLDPETLVELTVNGSPNIAVLPTSGQVRRWEGGAPAVVANGNWVALENGIEIAFDSGRFAIGDYWTIPARSLTAGIEWPSDSATAAPAILPPEGIRHHYCALALAKLTAGAWSVTDCRALFAPLTLQRSFLYLGGDGQEAMPVPANTAQPTELASPLRVGVVRGKTPVAGAIVEFEVTAGDGRLGNVAQNLTLRQLPTNADGIAEIAWSLDSQHMVQRVEARLLDAAGNRTHLPIHFTANLSLASDVSFDPANTPELAGANTVQEAIEKLTEITSTGCSTYVVTEGSDWVALLKSIKPGENAAVCFQRGRYETDETVELARLGHIKLSGAGRGTQIVAIKGECVLKFVQCASLDVHGLEIDAIDGGDPKWRPGARPGRMGALTAIECPEVDISDCALSCGAEVASERTCITLRGSTAQPLKSVHILRNRLTVGYAQDGILVTDCERCMIEGNEIAIKPGRKSLGKNGLVNGGFWRERLLKLIVAEPKDPARPPAGIGEHVITAGKFAAVFDTSVPKSEWARLVRENPPPPAATTRAAEFKRYVNGLVSSVTEQPERLATLGRTVRALENARGAGGVGPLDARERAALAVSSEIEFKTIEERPAGAAGAVTLRAGDHAIAFNSVLGEAEWNNAFALVPPVRKDSPQAISAHTRRIAARALADVQFRARIPGINGWIDNLFETLPEFARRGITCGGSVLTDLTITDNRIVGFEQGIHVGVSEKSDKTVSAGSVRVRENELLCRKHAPDGYAPCALFVGNVDSAWIERNHIGWAGSPDRKPYPQGIRVWGAIGRFLMINENRIDVATLGIRVRPLANIDAEVPNYQWVAAYNLAGSGPGQIPLKAPSYMKDRHNRPGNKDE